MDSMGTCPPMPAPYLYLSPYPVLHPQIGGYNFGNDYVPLLPGASKETWALRQKVAFLEGKVNTLETNVTLLQNAAALREEKIASLENHASDLALSLESYKLLRNRFISTFKRDKLGNATWDDLKIIAEGNGWAHGGDAVADAQLYKGATRRSDICDFELLYGLPPSIVADLSM